MTRAGQGDARPAPDVFSEGRLGPVTLRNRIVKAATFEGMSRDNLPSDDLVEFHRRVAAGGVGMTTVAYVGVCRDGMGAPNEIVMTERAVPGFQRIAQAVHDEGAALCVQIGHAGAVGIVPGKRVIAPMGGFAPTAGRLHAATEEDLAKVIRDFARTAELLVESGVDAIEVHLGHNYLASSFLSPKLNRRTDRWGGSVENRARLAREILRSVRGAVGQRIAVTAKLNMMDGWPGGLWIDESLQVAKLIESDRTIDALQLTGGSSLRNPMFLFRGDAPREEFAAALPPLVRLGFRLVAKKMMPEYPFQEAYFLKHARQFRALLELPLMLLGGINRLDTMRRAMAEGFDFVVMGRALLRDPNLVRKLQSGELDESLCIHCNRCMTTIYTGTRCVLPDLP